MNDGRPVAFIDWDHAGPLDPVGTRSRRWQNAQLYDDDAALLNLLPDAETTSVAGELILDGYGLAYSTGWDSSTG